MTFPTAVVIGKFLPPHRGHRHLIETALAQSREVTVIVCAKPDDVIPGAIRSNWLRAMHPQVKVLCIDDHYDPNDSALWARKTIEWLGVPPAAAFTSESYGDAYAKAMRCKHILVDLDRAKVPCSATMIRANPWRHWEFLEPPVRAWYALRFCVLGAESTGTTTLASALADALSTVWVPEYGREYCEAKSLRGGTEWTSAEFTAIANEQTRRENEAARLANRVLICDTNAFATRLWHRRYLGSESTAVEEIAKGVKCDFYLLTGDEIPFVQDGLRDGEHLRHRMHGWFVEDLNRQGVPWCLVQGSRELRLNTALERVRRLLNSSSSGSRPPLRKAAKD